MTTSDMPASAHPIEGSVSDIDIIKERGKEIRDLWLLDKDITYLNHGAFGALSREVFDATNDWRLKMESQPSRFIREDLIPEIRHTADVLGEYVGASGEDIVFVDNATTAINAVLRSLVLLPGDEIVTTNHVHYSALRTLEFICERAGARIQMVKIPLPLDNQEEVTEAVTNMLTPRTRLVLIDHITSPSALVFPIEQIIDECVDRGIPTMIDGAHGPGSLKLNIESLECDWYIGNCHKWLGAARGCAFLWTKKEHQHRVRPTTISERVTGGYTTAFDWPGTKDFAPYLSVIAALNLRKKFGEQEIHDYCHNLLIKGANHISNVWGTPRGAPDNMSLFMGSIQWPGPETSSEENMRKLRTIFRDQFNIEIELKTFNNKIWVRVSAYLYNEFSDFEAVAKAGLEIMQNNLIAKAE